MNTHERKTATIDRLLFLEILRNTKGREIKIRYVENKEAETVEIEVSKETAAAINLIEEELREYKGKKFDTQATNALSEIGRAKDLYHFKFGESIYPISTMRWNMGAGRPNDEGRYFAFMIGISDLHCGYANTESQAKQEYVNKNITLAKSSARKSSRMMKVLQKNLGKDRGNLHDMMDDFIMSCDLLVQEAQTIQYNLEEIVERKEGDDQ